MKNLLVAGMFALAFVVALAATSFADAHVTSVVKDASLVGNSGGSFVSHPLTVTACAEYTVEMTATLQPNVPFSEDALGFELWNDSGSVALTSEPFGQSVLHGPTQSSYLVSMRVGDDASRERVTFQAPCTEATPSLQIRIFNYLDQVTLDYSVGQEQVVEGVQIGSEG